MMRVKASLAEAQKLVLLMAHMMYALRLTKRMNRSRHHRQHLQQHSRQRVTSLL